jgi:hypothetical protein
MLTLRRYLALAALFFWQGGFTFYASVVVPVGQEELGHTGQGFITRQVTVWLNVSGAAALLLLGCEMISTRDPSFIRRRVRAFLWILLLVTLVGLFFLHHQLDQLLDPSSNHIRNRATFRPGHRLYLWISTVQWAASLGYLWLALGAWRAEDRISVIEAKPTE